MKSGPPEASGDELHRLCVFDLALTCGHLVTMAVDGWYPVSVACCDRLGGTILRSDYVPYASQVEYVRLRSERYVRRPVGAPREPSRLLARRSRTDHPHQYAHRPGEWSGGRYPARVGAASRIDGTATRPPD